MTRRDVAALVVRMAVENPQWGYTRIRGALSHLGHEIARTTVTRILHDHGIDPAPERSRRLPWKTFLQAHGEGLTACDLFTVEVLTLAGLQRYLVFFVIALQSRRVTIAGIHPQPYGTWMEQMARNVTDPVEGCLRRARYLIHDRDALQRDPRGRGCPADPRRRASTRRAVRPLFEMSQSRRPPREGPCVSSWARTSTTTIASETTRDSTTAATTATVSLVQRRDDCSISTTGRPHERSAIKRTLRGTSRPAVRGRSPPTSRRDHVRHARKDDHAAESSPRGSGSEALRAERCPSGSVEGPVNGPGRV